MTNKTKSILRRFHVFKLVYYSNPVFYLGITILVFTAFWILFNVLDELLYFSPILFFYIPSDAISAFILTNVSALLLGIVVSMNIYLLKTSKVRLGKSFVSGSFLGVITSACASCSSIGFLIISTFGGAGIIATTFLTNYQIPLRLLSIGILIWALYTVNQRVKKGCVYDNRERIK